MAELLAAETLDGGVGIQVVPVHLRFQLREHVVHHLASLLVLAVLILNIFIIIDLLGFIGVPAEILISLKSSTRHYQIGIALRVMRRDVITLFL